MVLKEKFPSLLFLNLQKIPAIQNIKASSDENNQASSSSNNNKDHHSIVDTKS
jgi:hypothetical protein